MTISKKTEFVAERKACRVIGFCDTGQAVKNGRRGTGHQTLPGAVGKCLGDLVRIEREKQERDPGSAVGGFGRFEETLHACLSIATDDARAIATDRGGCDSHLLHIDRGHDEARGPHAERFCECVFDDDAVVVHWSGAILQARRGLLKSRA